MVYLEMSIVPAQPNPPSEPTLGTPISSTGSVMFGFTPKQIGTFVVSFITILSITLANLTVSATKPSTSSATPPVNATLVELDTLRAFVETVQLLYDNSSN